MQRSRILGFALLATLVVSFPAQAQKQDKFRWDIWREIMVQDKGRVKPLESMAQRLVVEVVGRSSWKPEVFWTLNNYEIDDWAAFQKRLNADDPAAQRVLGLLPAALRKSATEQELDTDDLEKELEAAEKKVHRAATKLDEEIQDIAFYTLRQKILESKNQECLEALKKYDDILADIHQRNVGKSTLLQALNALLERRDLYDATAWPAARLTSEAKELLDLGMKQWDAPKLARFNRLLLEVAFGDTLAPSDGRARTVIQARRYDALELYVTWLMTWQGWDHLDSLKQIPERRWDSVYMEVHRPDGWDHMPLMDSRYQELARILAPETPKAVSPLSIVKNRMLVSPYSDIVRLKEQVKQSPAPVEKKTAAAMFSTLTFWSIRVGGNLHLGADQGTDNSSRNPTEADPRAWLSLKELLMGSEKLQLSHFRYGGRQLSDLRKGFFDARQGFLRNDPELFNAGSQLFASTLRRMGDESTLYATSKSSVDLELTYNQRKPFTWTWIMAFASAVALALSLGMSGKTMYRVGVLGLASCLGLMCYGIGMRVLISGRPPVTNMYETLIWSSFIACTLAMVLAAVYGTRIVNVASAVVLCLTTLLADFMPVDMGATIEPLQPVLRSNYWLIVHVMTIVASYGAFLLGWALSNIGLGYFLWGNSRSPDVKHLATFTYRSLQVGVLLLASGTILGGVWAAESWGRFWGWDPKEVWALIALIGYLIVLHARFVGLKHFGLFVGSVSAFMLVVMAWYGVNFVLGAGLHAYAFGTGGLWYVMSAVGANILYMVAAATYYSMDHNAPPAFASRAFAREDDEADDPRAGIKVAETATATAVEDVI